MYLIEDATSFKEKHKGSLKKLFQIIYLKQRLLKSVPLWSSITISLIILLIIFNYNIDYLQILNHCVNCSMSILPNILGFNLGGYVLLIGLNNEKVLNEIVTNDDEGYSLFQHTSSIFAWSVFIQSITLILSFIISTIINMNIVTNNYLTANIINITTLTILLILLIYSIILISRIILNVFSFSQNMHANICLNKHEESINDINNKKSITNIRYSTRKIKR